MEKERRWDVGDNKVMHIPEERVRTLLDMHAESICRLEQVAKEELVRLTSFVRALIGLTEQDIDRERKAEVPGDLGTH